MRLISKILLVTAACALSASPASAIPPQAPENSGTERAPASTPPENQGTAHKPATPGPRASTKAKGKAYGKYCQTQSKKHVKGQKGTPFSQCVTAMAKLASGETDSPATACKSLSKKHVRGEKGTPYSRCIVAAARLREEEDGD